MHDAGAEGLGLGEDRRTGRRGGRHDGQRALEGVSVLRVDQQRQHGRRAVEVGDALLVDQAPDGVVAHRPQAHLHPAAGDDRPRVAPAVAVEHRQRPEVHRVLPVAGGQVLAQAVEVGAAVRVHHALGRPGGARGVVDRDRRVLVLDGPRQGLVRAAREEVGVGDAGETRGDRLGVVVPDHLVHGQAVEDRRDRARQRGVDHDQARSRVGADRQHLLRREAAVDGHQHAAGERHGEMGHQQCRRVVAEVRHAVAGGDARGLEGPGDAGHLGGELPVRDAAVAVDHRHLLGEDGRRALQERQRGERCDVDRHERLPCRDPRVSRRRPPE